jgi:hypothetical protein
MTNQLVESYLLELEIQESIQIITERFESLSKEAILNQIKTNTIAITNYLKDLGINIKDVTSKDAKTIANIISNGFANKESPEKVSKKVISFLAIVIKRIWNPSTTAEKIESAAFLGIILTVLVAIVNSFLDIFLAKLAKFLSEGILAVLTLFIQWILSGPITEELLKRFFLKKLKNYGFISVGVFAFIETVFSYTKTSTFSFQLIYRLFVHLFLAFIQKIGIWASEKTDIKWFEYAAFILAVIIHSANNVRSSINAIGGIKILLKVITGDSVLV